MHKGRYKKSNSNTKVQEEAETNSETFCSKTNQRWICWLCYLPRKSSSLLICLLPYIRTRSLQCSPRLFLSCFVPVPPLAFSPCPHYSSPFLLCSCSVLTTLRSPLSLLPPTHTFPSALSFPSPLYLPPSFFLSFSNSFSKHVTSYSQLCSFCVNSLSLGLQFGWWFLFSAVQCHLFRQTRLSTFREPIFRNNVFRTDSM